MKLPRPARNHTRQRAVSDAKGPMAKATLGFDNERHGTNDRRLLNQRVKRSNHGVGSRSERLPTDCRAHGN
jgi:hypothetical protein